MRVVLPKGRESAPRTVWLFVRTPTTPTVACLTLFALLPSQVPHLTFGSELGVHYPYRWGIFLFILPALTIEPEHSWQGAYWISSCLSLPRGQSQLDFTHWSRRQTSISILLQFATFAGAICFRCISHFQLPYFFRLPFCICFAIKITGSQILQVT